MKYTAIIYSIITMVALLIGCSLKPCECTYEVIALKSEKIIGTYKTRELHRVECRPSFTNESGISEPTLFYNLKSRVCKQKEKSWPK